MLKNVLCWFFFSNFFEINFNFSVMYWRISSAKKITFSIYLLTWSLSNFTCISIFISNIDHNEDDELFLWYGWPTKGVKPYFQQEPLSEIFAIANLRHAACRVWTCLEPEFRLSWIKLYSSDKASFFQYTGGIILHK